MNDYALGAVEAKALFEREKDETFLKKKTSTSRRFIALTPYEFPAVFLNEFINCHGGMGVGVNDVVCTRTRNTNAESRNVCPLCLRLMFAKLWVQKAKEYWPVSIFYLLVPEVLLLFYWIGLKIFALTLLEKKKEIKLEHSEN